MTTLVVIGRHLRDECLPLGSLQFRGLPIRKDVMKIHHETIGECVKVLRRISPHDMAILCATIECGKYEGTWIGDLTIRYLDDWMSRPRNQTGTSTIQKHMQSMHKLVARAYEVRDHYQPKSWWLPEKPEGESVDFDITDEICDNVVEEIPLKNKIYVGYVIVTNDKGIESLYITGEPFLDISLESARQTFTIECATRLDPKVTNTIKIECISS